MDTVTGSQSRDELTQFVQAFLLDRDSAGCTPKTLAFYDWSLRDLVSWLHNHSITELSQVSSKALRQYLLSKRDAGWADSSQHAVARSARAWFNWLVAEGTLDVSPMSHVSMPRVAKKILPAFSVEDVKKLLTVCDRKTVLGARDFALVLLLIDTGLRATEAVSLTASSINGKGLVKVMGKGRKERIVRVGEETHKAIYRMLSWRGSWSEGDPMWLSYDLYGHVRGALTTSGLAIRLRHLGQQVGVDQVSPHRFRRTFAIMCLRDGMDIYTLARIMGHSDIQVLRRYLDLSDEDVERAHKLHSPVDKLF